MTHKARGFSLLEVLIALVVLSVGLLGLAALQAEGLRGSSSAVQRTTAVNYASDIADRMRANRAGLGSYAIALGASGSVGQALTCADDHSGTSQISASVCTSQQIAQYDVFVWKSEMIANNYDGSIAAVAGAANRFTILVQWTDRTLAANNTQSYSTVIQF